MHYQTAGDAGRYDHNAPVYCEGEALYPEDAAQLIDASDCLDEHGVARRDIYPHDFVEG